MKSVAKVSLFAFALLLTVNLHAQAYLDEYINLYPDCVDDEASEIYSINEPFLEEPVFPGGGRVQMTRYVHAHTEIPDVKDGEGNQLKGKVLIKTVINRCGVAEQIEVIESLSAEHDAEAVRVIEGFPFFKPGSLDGVRVKVAMIVPVYFTRTYVAKKKRFYYDDGSFYEEGEDDYNYEDSY